MSEEHAVDIAVLYERLGALETNFAAHRTETKQEIGAIDVKLQTLIDAWNSATLLGKFLGLLGTIATILSAIWAFFPHGVDK